MFEQSSVYRLLQKLLWWRYWCKSDNT